MHPSVRAVWVEFNEPLEGLLTRLYADVKGLVTTGMGNLVDPIGAALTLPWELPGGIPAGREAIIKAWNTVKNDPLCATKGWKYAVGLPANNIRLSLTAVHDLINKKLDEHDLRMRIRFSDWETRPADAQLAAHSMAWAMGHHFFRKFPKFTAAFTRGDYLTASAECAISPAHGTIVERNRRNVELLTNAANYASEPDVLVWTFPTS